MLLSGIIRKKFDAVLGRYEGNPALYTYAPEEFAGLQTEPFPISGPRGVELKGYFYYYDRLDPEKLVVFDHGIGSGHRAYLKEIEYLAGHGWTVYSYDHTGCAETGGSGILGFAQGICDLDCVLTALSRDERFRGKALKAAGHSWGGYAAMNAAARHPEVSHVVSLAGFLSARSLIEQYLPKFVMRYSEEVMERERQHNPVYADMDARESIRSSGAKLMHLQSRDDRMVEFERSSTLLSQALAGRENTEFVTVDHRNHDPHRTDRAAQANARMEALLAERTKKHLLDTPEQQKAFRESQNWDEITEQDPVIWEKILKFLEQ